MSVEEIISPARLLRCSAVVTTWKRPAQVKETLESLMCQSYPNAEVIVVCDGEDAEVRSIAHSFRQNRPIRWVFHTENLGPSAARNTGAREATGDVVLFLDDDVVADSELITSHMGHHQTASPDRRLAVCSVVREDRRTQLSSYIEECLHTKWIRTLEDCAATLRASGIDSIGKKIERIIWLGLNCSIRRDLFLSSGGFNERLRASNEDMELGLRLYRSGVEFIFEPRQLLTHRNSKELRGYFEKAWGASGALDTYRVFGLGEKTVQTQHLVSMFRGSPCDRMKSRCAWHLSQHLRTVARQLAIGANRTEWRPLFEAWSRVSQAGEYWSNAKAAGCTLKRLKNAVGSSRRALLLHSISRPLSRQETAYCIAPRRFQSLLSWFCADGYRTATIGEWLQEDIPENHVLLTFDDGYSDLFDHLLPLVIEHRLTPVVYLVVDRIGATDTWNRETGFRARNLLTLGQIREMQKYGVEFGSHSLTHAWLPAVSDAQLRREVIDSKQRLEDILGAEIPSFAYPRGGVDRRVRSAVSNAGYKLAFTNLPGANWWNDPLCQTRADVNGYTTIPDLALKLRTGLGFAERFNAFRKQPKGIRFESLSEP